MKNKDKKKDPKDDFVIHLIIILISAIVTLWIAMLSKDYCFAANSLSDPSLGEDVQSFIGNTSSQLIVAATFLLSAVFAVITLEKDRIEDSKNSLRFTYLFAFVALMAGLYVNFWGSLPSLRTEDMAAPFLVLMYGIYCLLLAMFAVLTIGLKTLGR